LTALWYYANRAVLWLNGTS